MATTTPVTIFKWGYDGWGNATDLLVRTVDAVERAREHAPPFFVDIRFRRSVRAKGFSGNAFEQLLGPERHRWMKGLGNEAIGEDRGEIRIHRPEAAEELLDLAIEVAGENRRVIFFCSCGSPAGAAFCHRSDVAELLLSAAKRRKQALEVDEWPGGTPAANEVHRVRIDSSVLRKVRSGARRVALADEQASTALAGLPWGGIVVLDAGDDEQVIAGGPLQYYAKRWVLPVFVEDVRPDATREEVRVEAMYDRAEKHLEPSHT